MNEQIAQTIKQAIPDATVHTHSPDGVHFSALVVSPSFEGQTRVEQQKRVMKALESEFDSDRVHALELKTFTPEAWERNKHRFNLSQQEPS